MQHETFEQARSLRSAIEKLKNDQNSIENLIRHANNANQGEGYLGFTNGTEHLTWLNCPKEVLAYWQKAIDIELKVAQETFDNL